MQAARGVDDEDVRDDALGLIQRLAGDIGGRCAVWRTPEFGVYLLRQALELKNGGRTAHVGADQQHPLALALDQPARQLGGRRGLTRTLQTGQAAPRWEAGREG